MITGGILAVYVLGTFLQWKVNIFVIIIHVCLAKFHNALVFSGSGLGLSDSSSGHGSPCLPYT